MSVKHVEEYYEQVANQLNETKELIKAFEKEAQENMIEPERFEQIKKTIEPIKINYQTLSWVMYLLHKPNKKEKIKKYEKQNLSKFIKQHGEDRSPNAVVDEGKKALENLSKLC